jgi:hypothetical protein
MQNSQKSPEQEVRETVKEVRRIQQSSLPESSLRLTPEQEALIREQMEQPTPQHQPGRVNPEALPEEEQEARASLNRRQRKAADKKFLKSRGVKKPRLRKLLRRNPPR